MSKQVRLTLPDDLYKLLEEQAAADDRTVANYITHLLKYLVKKYNKPGRSDTLLEFIQKKFDSESLLYFPPGVRTPLSPNTIHTMPSPETQTGRPIVTCEQKNK